MAVMLCKPELLVLQAVTTLLADEGQKKLNTSFLNKISGTVMNDGLYINASNVHATLHQLEAKGLVILEYITVRKPAPKSILGIIYQALFGRYNYRTTVFVTHNGLTVQKYYKQILDETKKLKESLLKQMNEQLVADSLLEQEQVIITQEITA